MIGVVVALLARIGVRDRLQAPLAWLIVVVVIGAGVVLGLKLLGGQIDRMVDARVAAERDRQRGDVMTKAVEAERAGAAAQRASDAAFANTQADYRKAIDDAADDDASPLDALGNRMRR